MKKIVLPVILMLAMGLSLSVYAEEKTGDTAEKTKETTETTKDENEETSKSAHLLAEGYEFMEGITIPSDDSEEENEYSVFLKYLLDL